MTTLGNTDTPGYKPLYNTNSSISKEKSSVSEVSSNTTSRESLTSRETVSSIELSTNTTFQLSKSNNTGKISRIVVEPRDYTSKCKMGKGFVTLYADKRC